MSRSFWAAVIMLLLLPFVALAQSKLLARLEDNPPPASERRIAELEARIERLEQRAAAQR